MTPAGLKAWSGGGEAEERGAGEGKPYQRTPGAGRTRDHTMGGCLGRQSGPGSMAVWTGSNDGHTRGGGLEQWRPRGVEEEWREALGGRERRGEERGKEKKKRG